MRESIAPKTYNSPTFELIETEFKDTLLSFNTDILLNDLDLLKNISEKGIKIILHLTQLKQLIAILYLSKDDRNRYSELIEIETEPVVSTCLCRDIKIPFYQRIKSIIINKETNFLITPYGTNLSSVFKASLECCLTEKEK
jgi:hypothetical protein